MNEIAPPQTGTLIGTRHLNRSFIGYLGAFFLVGLSLSVIYGLSAFLKTKDFQSAFDSTLLMWGAFATGIVIALLVTAMFGKNLINSLEQKMNKENVISTQEPLLVSGDSPFIGFNFCFIIVVLLNIFNDQLYPFITSTEFEQKVSQLTMPCLFHPEELQLFVLGIGAGIAFWSFMWAKKKEKSAPLPILLNFYWIKHSSRELGIIVFSIILLYIIF